MRHLRLLLSSLVLAFVAACGDGSEPSAEQGLPTETVPSAPEETTEAPEPTTEGATTEKVDPEPAAPPGVPRFVAGYRDWVKLNDRPIPPRDADPHLGTKNVYASEERRPNGRFPYGTIVVKDATRPGTEFIGLIAIMRKERGADPAHHDWVFVEYAREARSDRFEELASGAVCWSCHMGALQNDYVFTE
jgi:hypothetical protein